MKLCLILFICFFSFHSYSEELENTESTEGESTESLEPHQVESAHVDSAPTAQKNCHNESSQKQNKNIPVQIGYLYGNSMSPINDQKAGEAFLLKSKSLFMSQGYQVITQSVNYSDAKILCNKFKEQPQSRIILVANTFDGSGASQVAQCLNDAHIKTELFIAMSSLKETSSSNIPSYIENSFTLDELQHKLDSTPTNENICENDVPAKKDSVLNKNSLKDLVVVGVLLLEAYLVYKATKLIYTTIQNQKTNAANTAAGTSGTASNSTPGNYTGSYSGSINPASAGVFGDGSWPDGDKKLASRPDIRGLGYALGGSFEFSVAANGKLTGSFIIWGQRASITSGQLPAGSNIVHFQTDGATGEITFLNNGTISGKIFEPEAPNYKLGLLSGGKK